MGVHITVYQQWRTTRSFRLHEISLIDLFLELHAIQLVGEDSANEDVRLKFSEGKDILFAIIQSYEPLEPSKLIHQSLFAPRSEAQDWGLEFAAS
jgi:hypothetical protein